MIILESNTKSDLNFQQMCTSVGRILFDIGRAHTHTKTKTKKKRMTRAATSHIALLPPEP